ncbi:MAG: hypothetical protein WCI73_05735 [Phycisphaerae bacterium]
MKYAKLMNSARLIAAMAVLLAWMSTGRAWAYDNAANGYHLEVPESWMQIPQSDVEAMLKVVAKPGSHAITYDAVFQQEAGPPWFAYPYIMVQPLPYTSFGLSRQMRDDEFPGLMKAITGLDMSKVLDERLSKQATDLMDSPRFENPQLDTAARRARYTLHMNVKGVGEIRGQAMLYFGRDAAIQVVFYAPEKEWSKYAASADTAAGSLQFTPAKAYDPALNSNPLLRASITGAAVGLLVGGLIVVMKMRQKGKTSGAQSTDSGQQKV